MQVINAKALRGELREILERVRKGERFTVLYRNRPVCQLVPVDEQGQMLTALENDSLYGAEAVGRSRDGKTAEQHDELLYGAPD